MPPEIVARRTSAPIALTGWACAVTGQSDAPCSCWEKIKIRVMQTSPTTMRKLAASRSDMPVITPRPATVESPLEECTDQRVTGPAIQARVHAKDFPMSSGCSTERNTPAKTAMPA